MKKIVIPYDFSAEAELALDAATQYAQIDPSDLHLVHVVEVPSSYLSLYPEYGSLDLESVFDDDILKSIDQRLQAVVQRVKEKGPNVTSDVVHGKPFESIQKTIAHQEADLIFMGSKGATGLKEMFVGSNTERVIRNAKVPVFTVKQKVDFSAISDLVYATDFVADKSLAFAKQLQKLLHLKIRLLKVYNTNEWVYTERSAMEKLKEFGIENGLQDYSLHVIDSPFVTDGILKFAHEKKADLIVMGTHGYTGLGHLIAGSNAEGVANHSKIPIFTVHK